MMTEMGSSGWLARSGTGRGIEQCRSIALAGQREDSSCLGLAEHMEKWDVMRKGSEDQGAD
jgi:hypothetical protein